MFIYFGKNFSAANVDACFVGVQCEKCSCAYYYHLARIGIGGSSAPYNIGQASAAAASEEMARQEAQRRLATEAELVPCPRCNWINEDLIRGYRRARFTGFATAALCIAFVVVPLSVVFWWVFSQGAFNDRYLAPYFLYGGPGLTIALAAGLLVLRQVLRSGIQPNRNYPNPPRLPPGTPPALFKDEKTDEFRPANAESLVQSDGRIDFQIGRHRLPLICCECLKPTTTEHSIKIAATGILEVPLCRSCASQPQQVFSFFWILTAPIVLLTVGMAVVFWFFNGNACLNLCVILVSLIGGPLAALRWYRRSQPVPLVDAHVIDESRGVVRLGFRNPEYARLVAKQITDADEMESSRSGLPSAGSQDNTHIRAASSRDIERGKTDP